MTATNYDILCMIGGLLFALTVLVILNVWAAREEFKWSEHELDTLCDGEEYLDEEGDDGEANDAIVVKKEQHNINAPVRVPFGIWSLHTGYWYPNTGMQMTEEEQHASNVRNGFSCAKCFRAKTACNCALKEKGGNYGS